jgi:hypothetical protein
MAAGGFREFVAGEILTEDLINDYLLQGVLVFAGTAARGSAITSPVEGQFAFLKTPTSSPTILGRRGNLLKLPCQFSTMSLLPEVAVAATTSRASVVVVVVVLVDIVQRCRGKFLVVDSVGKTH